MDQSDHTGRPNIRPVSLRNDREARRRLRLREMMVLGLLGAMMIGAWFITLKA